MTTGLAPYFSIVLFLSLVATATIAQQPGQLDTTFRPMDGVPGTGFLSSTVEAIGLQMDGSIVIGGAFDYVGQQAVGRLIRVDSLGIPDSSFNTSIGADNTIFDLEVLPNGKTIIAGSFTTYDAIPVGGVARLNDDGSLDTSFDPGIGANDQIADIVVQPDGRIILVGRFTELDAQPANRIVRLNADGSQDASFDTGLGANGEIICVALQPDGRIVIGGSFTEFNSSPQRGLTRLNANGSLDGSFQTGTGVDGSVRSIGIDDNGSIIFSGVFNSYNDAQRINICRVDQNGQIDPSFHNRDGIDGPVYSMLMLDAGKILIGGSFSEIEGRSISIMTILDADGSIANCSFADYAINYSVRSLVKQPDGKILVGGQFTTCLGHHRERIVRIDIDGQLDLDFWPTSGISGPIYDLVVQPDDHIIVNMGTAVGNASIDNTTVYGMARLTADGDLDPTFDVGIGTEAGIADVALMDDGRLFICGDYYTTNGTSRRRQTRLQSDGSVDMSFDVGLWPLVWFARSVAVQPDGKSIVGGREYSNLRTLGRYNIDGTEDTGFLMGDGPNGYVLKTLILPNGKIIIGGVFNYYDGTQIKSIARLHPNGLLDTTFNPGLGPDDFIRHMALDANGKIIIAGEFSNYNGVPMGKIARLEPNGALDSTFNSGSGADDDIHIIKVLENGKILVGGKFNSFDSHLSSGIVMLNADGSVDADFNVGSGATGNIDYYSNVYSMDVQSDGKILLSGSFVNYDGEWRPYLIRLHGYGPETTVTAQLKVFLEGPYDENDGLMDDAIRVSGLLPTAEPYTDLGFQMPNGGGEMILDAAFNNMGGDAIVDWVLVELRDVLNSANVISARTALVQRDGDVVDVDGVSPVSLIAQDGNYHVAIRHRNHLGTMTENPVTLGDIPVSVDFSSAGLSTYGTAASKTVLNNVQVLWSGNSVQDGAIKYTGLDNDRDPILVAIGGSVPTATIAGYWNEDVTMDGVVKYVGLNNDRDPILVNIGGLVVTNVKIEQLP